MKSSRSEHAIGLRVDANGDPYIAASTGNWGEGGFAKFSQPVHEFVPIISLRHMKMSANKLIHSRLLGTGKLIS